MRQTFATIFFTCFLVHSAQARLLEEVVVTAARSEQAIAKVDTNIAVVSGDELEIIGSTHISESMNRVAGAWISRGNGQEHLTALRSPVLTGAGACGAFLMAQDGIPLRASGFCNLNELFDANSEQAGRIEVIKGPASVLYGSNAMHGMINVLTAPVTPVRRVGVEAGPHDYYRARLSLGTDRWRLDGNGTTDGGYKDDSGFDQQKLTLKYASDGGRWRSTTTFSASNLNQETAGYILGFEAYKQDALRKTNPNPEAYRDTQSARLYSRMERDTPQGTTFVVTPYARFTRMTFIQHFLPGQAIEENGQGSIGVQTAAYWPNWTMGIDAEATNGFLKETQPNPTQGSAFLVETIPQGKHYDYEVDATTLAAFAEYRVGLGDAAELSAGLRAEYVGYRYDNKMIAGRTRDDGTPCGFGGCRFNRPGDRDDSFGNVSPRLALHYSLSESSQLYLGISRGFRAPQTSELYRLQNTQSVSDIASEKLDSIELGARGGDDVSAFDVSVYAMRKHNYIFQNTNRENVDNGKTSHHGIELSVSHRLSKAVRGNLTWSHAVHKYDNTPALAGSDIDGNDIDTAPRNTGWASLVWIPVQDTTAELEWVHMGRYFEDPQNLHSYPGHDIFNLRVRTELGRNVTGFFRVINIGDTKYAERADYAFGNDRYFVGEPRSVYVGVSMGF